MINWLRRLLSDNADFEFYTVKIDYFNVVVLIICSAADRPVSFERTDYIRIGSYTKKLNEYPAVQTNLWDKLRSNHFEDSISQKDLQLDRALQLIDYATYFDLKDEPLPSSHENVMHYLVEEGIAEKQDNGLYSITNLGALLFAKKMSDFPNIARKAIRVVQYNGENRIDMLREDTGSRGYATGFEGLVKFIAALLPTREVIHIALRETETAYPILAIREAIANALIHQNFTINGTGPVIEIFSNRIEITNPGLPLIDIKRIIDNPPRSRNEKLASLMRRLKMCEELGTGWDKIATCCELSQLPAPKINLYEENTRVILYSYIPFTNLAPRDKLGHVTFTRA